MFIMPDPEAIIVFPSNFYGHFRNGGHTMHKSAGFYKGIWSDMSIETSDMRYSHSRRGIIGLTLKQGSLKTWAYSLHIYNSVINNLGEMSDSNICNKI